MISIQDEHHIPKIEKVDPINEALLQLAAFNLNHH
jgi:hypothetical protein